MRQLLAKKNMSRLTALILAAILVCACIPTAYAEGESGTCGGNLSWSLSAGTLTITGSGSMDQFSEPDMAPWYAYREEISRVVLPEGLTSIGALAFYGCTNLTAVVIPDSVESIGRYAFASCTSLVMITLGDGVRTIGESAFSDCVRLSSIRLPDTLATIGMNAFYRCESLSAITIPHNVRTIGATAFGYCKSLVSATVHANIEIVPEWMFYGCEQLTVVSIPSTVSEISDHAFRGCDQLTSVYYDGDSMTEEEIQESIGEDVPSFETTGHVTEGTPPDTTTSGVTYENGDGTITQQNNAVTEGDVVSVTVTLERTMEEETSVGGDYAAQITVTLDDEDGWDEALELIEDALWDINNAVSGNLGQIGQVELVVYDKSRESLNADFVAAMAGRNVRLTVTTVDGSSWRMNCRDMKAEEMSGEYDLSYGMSITDQSRCQEMGAASAFTIRFKSYAEVNAEVLIWVGASWARQNVTLFQRVNGQMIRHQTVVVDGVGYVHLYLASVTDETDYYIALNVTLEEGESPIVPDELLGEYGGDDIIRYQPIEYQITGRVSSWGLDIMQFTWIIVAFMVVCIGGVGFVMYRNNQRKLAMGYVPEYDDEDEDDE